MTRQTVSPDVEAKLEAAAVDDYRAVAGRTVLLRHVTAYVGDTDDQGDFNFDPPARFRVDPCQDVRPERGLYHWVDEYLDPYWEVTPLPRDVRTAHLRSCYTFGPSYNGLTGRREGTLPQVVREHAVVALFRRAAAALDAWLSRDTQER